MKTKFKFSNGREIKFVEIDGKKYSLGTQKDAERLLAIIANRYTNIDIVKINHYDDNDNLVESFDIYEETNETESNREY